MRSKIIFLAPGNQINSDECHFRNDETQGTFVLTDALGRKVNEETFIANRYRFERKQLPSGVYFFRIMDFTGKIILK